MTETNKPSETCDTETLHRESLRILRRLCETGAVLAVATEMQKAVVVRDTTDGASTKTAVVDRSIAQALAVSGWISCKSPARISRYCITSSGRAELNRLLAKSENEAQGFGEAASSFAPEGSGRRAQQKQTRRVRFALAESPLVALARRKDKFGNPFLDEELVAAGEQLREDFELAQLGPKTTQNWERFLAPGHAMEGVSTKDSSHGPIDASNRVTAALQDLGEGLSDVVLRCCCYLEGLETAEKKLGWSARSGKIVLRIALIRLREHYRVLDGPSGRLIG